MTMGQKSILQSYFMQAAANLLAFTVNGKLLLLLLPNVLPSHPCYGSHMGGKPRFGVEGLTGSRQRSPNVGVPFLG